jgi:hypothetical protein
MSSTLNGLTLVGFLIATVLVGIASTLDARSRWSNMSEHVRRFVRNSYF